MGALDWAVGAWLTVRVGTTGEPVYKDRNTVLVTQGGGKDSDGRQRERHRQRERERVMETERDTDRGRERE